VKLVPRDISLLTVEIWLTVMYLLSELLHFYPYLPFLTKWLIAPGTVRTSQLMADTAKRSKLNGYMPVMGNSSW